MKVQVIDEKGKAQSLLRGCGTEAELKEYINKITKKPDPMIVYAPGRFVHMSTIVHRWNWQVQNIKTGEIITTDNLSPATGGILDKSKITKEG